MSVLARVLTPVLLHVTSSQAVAAYTLHSKPYALHPTPYTPPYNPTLHPTPYTLHLTPYTRTWVRMTRSKGWCLGAGLAAGPAAGILLGACRRFYCVYGNTVNLAARMCQTGATSDRMRSLTIECVLLGNTVNLAARMCQAGATSDRMRSLTIECVLLLGACRRFYCVYGHTGGG
jgi:hypothetical protein